MVKNPPVIPGDLGFEKSLKEEMGPPSTLHLEIHASQRGPSGPTVHGVSGLTEVCLQPQFRLLGGKIILQIPMLLPRFNFLSCPNACLEETLRPCLNTAAPTPRSLLLALV